MADGWRDNRYDRTAWGALADLFIALWSILVLVWLVLLVLPYRLFRWVQAERRRTTTQQTRRDPEEGKDEYNRDIWRYGR